MSELQCKVHHDGSVTLRGARFHRREIQDLARFIADAEKIAARAEKIASRVSWAEAAASLVKALVANRVKYTTMSVYAAGATVTAVVETADEVRRALDTLEEEYGISVATGDVDDEFRVKISDNLTFVIVKSRP